MAGCETRAACISMKVVSGASVRARAVARSSPRRREGRVHLPHVQRQAAQRAVAFQRHPVRCGRRVGVQLEHRSGGCGIDRQPPQPQRPRHLQARAHDAVVDHHHRHGRARDDVDVMRRAARLRLGHQVKADIARSQSVDLGLRDADQDDGFGVLDQLYPGHMRVRVHRDQCGWACRNSRWCRRNPR